MVKKFPKLFFPKKIELLRKFQDSRVAWMQISLVHTLVMNRLFINRTMAPMIPLKEAPRRSYRLISLASRKLFNKPAVARLACTPVVKERGCTKSAPDATVIFGSLICLSSLLFELISRFLESVDGSLSIWQSQMARQISKLQGISY